MYAYDDIDHDIVAARIDEFRDQVQRRVSGQLTEDEFKPLRLMNGLYLQLHGYMLRVAIPYGTLSSNQMRRLAHIAREYDRGYGHFTTRQNIQYNWPRLDQTPDILAELAEVEMHAIQTSGNCIRNVTSDPYAGAVADEIEDPRITCEVIRQWSTFHPEFSFLPRKFKIAVTASPEDRAAIAVHDIGLALVRNEAGDVGFRVFVGGGQGRTPHLAAEIRSYLPRTHLLGYLEAIMRVYNRHGRRDNIYKARIKILVNALGPDAFAEEVEAEWQAIKGDAVMVDVGTEEWQRVAAGFELRLPPPAPRAAPEPLTADERVEYQRWVERNVVDHKDPLYAIAVISLKPVGGIPGDASAEQMDVVADLGDEFSGSEIRVTHQQNLVLPHVPRTALVDLWKRLLQHELATANRGLITDIICCPGMDYCSLANTRSIPLAQSLAQHFADPEKQRRLGDISLNISGCINACGHHHVGNIGILGIDKRGQEFFQVAIGGSSGSSASLAEVIGPAVAESEIPQLIERITGTYETLKREGESLLQTVRRVGKDTFKESIHATADK